MQSLDHGSNVLSGWAWSTNTVFLEHNHCCIGVERIAERLFAAFDIAGSEMVAPCSITRIARYLAAGRPWVGSFSNTVLGFAARRPRPPLSRSLAPWRPSLPTRLAPLSPPPPL